jgi:taurine transport system permease protein
MIVLLYLVIFGFAYVAYRFWDRSRHHIHDFASLKTVTFGDESAVSPNRFASVVSIIALFAIWGAFTGSVITPIHVPGPFVGDTSFTYTAAMPPARQITQWCPYSGLPCRRRGAAARVSDTPNTFAVDDAVKIGAWRSASAASTRTTSAARRMATA